MIGHNIQTFILVASSSMYTHNVCARINQKTKTFHLFLLLSALPKKEVKRRNKNHVKIACNFLNGYLNSLSTIQGEKEGRMAIFWSLSKILSHFLLIRSFSTLGLSLNVTSSERLPPALSIKVPPFPFSLYPHNAWKYHSVYHNYRFCVCLLPVITTAV